MTEFILKLFGKEVRIFLLDADEVTAGHIIDEACKLGLSLHKVFDVYDRASEISMLNRKRQLRVSRPLLEAISKALEFSRLTHGNYDVTLGKYFMQRKSGAEETDIECSFHDIDIAGDLVTLKNENVMIDLGSVAKGYITDRMAEHIISEGVGAGLIDARGDIRIFGNTGQTVGIQHPRDKDKIAGYVYLKDAAVATSGDYSQFKGDFGNCHILNRRELISVTAVAPTLMMADLIATAIFVADKDDRRAILDAHKDVRVLTIDRDLNMMHHNGFEELKTK